MRTATSPVVAVADGGRARSAGRVPTTPEDLGLFAESLAPDDRVVLEATGNALAIAHILAPHVAEVVLAHAQQVRAISHARMKADKVDARLFADLLGRRPDSQGLRWAMSAPAPCVDWSRVVEACLKRRTQVKNEISAVLQRNR